MFMSESEIVSRYRQAKSKNQQITILAEINLCDRKDIIELLTLNGAYQNKPSSRKTRWNDEECQKLERLLERSMTTREIAAIYGYKPNVMASTVAYLRSRGKLQRRLEGRSGRRPQELQTA